MMTNEHVVINLGEMLWASVGRFVIVQSKSDGRFKHERGRTISVVFLDPVSVTRAVFTCVMLSSISGSLQVWPLLSGEVH